MSQVFDPYQVILEEHLFGGDDGTVLSDFEKEQTKLHLLNKLGGKIFNPVGFAASLAQSSENTFVRQLAAQATSDLLNAGIFETSDGITFARVADTDGEGIFYDEVDEFKQDINGSGNSFLGNALSAGMKKIADAVGIETSGTRSILAQVLAYNTSDIQDKLKGTQGKFKDYYGEDEYSPKGTDTITNVDPVGVKVIGYTHDIGELARNPLKLVKLRRDIANGLYAQNVMVPKDKVVLEAEEGNRSQKIANKQDFLNRLGRQAVNRVTDLLNNPISNLVNAEDAPDDFYVRRMVEFDPFGGISETSGSPFIEDGIPKLYELWFRDFFGQEEYNDELVDNFYFSFLTEAGSLIEGGSGADIEFSRQEKLFEYDPNNDTDNIPETLNNNTKQQAEFIKSYGIKSVLDRNRQHNFGEYQKMVGDANINDPVLSSDIAVLNGFESDEYENDDFDANEFLYMSFQDVRNRKTIFLRPTASSLNEDIQANFSPQIYLGRTEGIPSYEQTTRTLSISFTIAPRTPDEYLMMYKKLDFLNSLNYPEADENFRMVKSPLIKFSLGDLYKNLGGYITSFSKTFLEEYPWETSQGYIAPKIVECGMTLVVLHDEMPYLPVGIGTNYGYDSSVDENNRFNLHYIKQGE